MAAPSPRLTGKSPEPFRGENALCDAFLRNCELYFELNTTFFPDDVRKVLTAYTWIDVNVPKLRRWRDERQDDAHIVDPATGTPKGYGTWKEFRDDLVLNFGIQMKMDVARHEIESFAHHKGTPLAHWRDTFQMMFKATKYDEQWGLHQVNKMVQPHIIDEYDIILGANPTAKAPGTVATYLDALVKVDQRMTQRAAERSAQRGHNPPKAFADELHYWRDTVPCSSHQSSHHDPNAMDVDRFDASGGRGRGFTPGRGASRPSVVGRPSIPQDEIERRRQEHLCFACGRKGCSSRWHNWPDRDGGPLVYHATPRRPANTRVMDTDFENPDDSVESRQVRFNPSVTVAPASPEPSSSSLPSQEPTLINRLRTIDSEACEIWSETMSDALKDPSF